MRPNVSVLQFFRPVVIWTFRVELGSLIKTERWISAHKITDLEFLISSHPEKKISCGFIVASNDYNETYFSALPALPFTCNWRLTSHVSVWITFSIMLHNGEIWHGSKHKFPKMRCIKRLMNGSVWLPFFNCRVAVNLQDCVHRLLAPSLQPGDEIAFRIVQTKAQSGLGDWIFVFWFNPYAPNQKINIKWLK